MADWGEAPIAESMEESDAEVDEAFKEYAASLQRLSDVCELYQVYEETVEGDGNCQFNSVAAHCSDATGSLLRAQAVLRMRWNPDRFRPFAPGDWDSYLEHMATESVAWGDRRTSTDFNYVHIFLLMFNDFL